jgi:hypothetical protein
MNFNVVEKWHMYCNCNPQIKIYFYYYYYYYEFLLQRMALQCVWRRPG